MTVRAAISCMGLTLLLAVTTARAQELSRDDLLAAIDRLSTPMEKSKEDLVKISKLAKEFLARFPEDGEAPMVRLTAGISSYQSDDFDGAIEHLRGLNDRYARFLLGLALAERGRDAEAEDVLAALAKESREPAHLYALGEVRERAGNVAGAREALEGVAAAKDARLKAKARGDLEDLAKIGAPAPRLEGLTPTATATVVAFSKPGDDALDRELASLGAGVVRVKAGWDDARIKEWRVPVMPRVYVLDSRGIVRAAGVRGAAIAAAVLAVNGR